MSTPDASDSPRTQLTIRVPWSATGLFTLLFGCELLLLAADLAVWNLVDAPKLKAIFDLTLEANVPTFFASTQALVVGLACLLVTAACHEERAPKWRTLGWLGTGLFFLFIAMDDASQFHERVATVWSASIKSAPEESLGRHAVDSFASYYWQLLILPFFAIAGVAIAVFVVRELRGLRRAWLFLAGIGFFAAAVLLDYFDALEQVYEPSMDVFGASFDVVQHGFRATEESIEMFGTSCILVAVVGHYALVTGALRERASRGYGGLIATMVAAVAAVATLAAAILVISWVAIQSVPTISVARAPLPVGEEAFEPTAVDARALAVHGLWLGMTVAEARQLGGVLGVSFRIHDGEPAKWTVLPRQVSVVEGGTLVFSRGELVGLTLVLTKPDPGIIGAWRAVLPTPYRSDDTAEHWQTTNLEAKAERDGRRIYVADKRFCADVPW